MTQVLLLLALTQTSYNRSRVGSDDTNLSAQCLYWREGTVIEYRQSADGNPETGPTAFTAVTAAFASWQAQLDFCGSLTLREGARTSSRQVGYVDGAGDNENVVLFRQKKCSAAAPAADACWSKDNCGNAYDCWQHSAGAIAITTTSYVPSSGKILDSDVELNQPSFIFTTVDAPVCPVNHYSTSCVATDVQNTMTHEAGHVLGLAHINLSTSTMYPRADPGDLGKRVIDPGSKQFICDTYPKGAPSRSCLTVPFDGTLGKPSQGCAAAPGGLSLGLAAVLALSRRR